MGRKKNNDFLRSLGKKARKDTEGLKKSKEKKGEGSWLDKINFQFFALKGYNEARGGPSVSGARGWYGGGRQIERGP